MSFLPRSASFASFFAVLAIMTALTVVLRLNLSAMLRLLAKAFQLLQENKTNAKLPNQGLLTIPVWTIGLIVSYIEVLDKSDKTDGSMLELEAKGGFWFQL